MLADLFSGQGISCCYCPSEHSWSLLQPGAERFHLSSLNIKKRIKVTSESVWLLVSTFTLSISLGSVKTTMVFSC